MSVQAMLSQLRKDPTFWDELREDDFDRLFPISRTLKPARRHWTPIGIARIAVRFLTEGSSAGNRILDVGSNVGKFCVVGSLSSNAKFVGAELRGDLCTLAKKVVKDHALERIRYHHGSALELDWAEFEGIYFYNPFQEFVMPEMAWDDQILMTGADHEALLRAVRTRLEGLRSGTRVVTFWGWGEEMPEGFEEVVPQWLLEHEMAPLSQLRFFIKK